VPVHLKELNTLTTLAASDDMLAVGLLFLVLLCNMFCDELDGLAPPGFCVSAMPNVILLLYLTF